ncbi:MAG: replication protein [archaeon]|nr:replication protein [archaeon]
MSQSICSTENQSSDRGIWFELELWKDTTTYDTEYIINSFPLLYNQRKLKEYFYILHDKDNQEHPHYHIVLAFTQQIWKHQIKKLLGIPLEHKCHIEKVTDRNAFFLYMTHQTTDSKHKYQYSTDDVFASNMEYFLNAYNYIKITTDDESYQMLEEIEDYLGTMTINPSYYNFTKWLRAKGPVYYNLYLNKKYYFHLNTLYKDMALTHGRKK